MLNLRKHSNQTELDPFFKTLLDKKEASQEVTKQAFFQARKQLSYTAFTALNYQLNNDIYNSDWMPKTWKGFRLCAIDYAYLLKQNISFCMRAKTNQSLVIKDFVKSGKREAIVTFEPNKPSIKTCEEKRLSTKPITLRLVRVDLPNEVEVLVTNLMDEETYDSSIFKSLYHLRWGIEENYKRLKQWVEIENFSGKSALSVKQDFYAKILASNLTTLMEIQAQEIVDKRTRYLKRNYQINYAQALSKMKHRIVLLITSQTGKAAALIKQSILYISKTIEAVKPDRSYPRRLKNIKNNIHFPAYKCSL